MTEIEEIPIEQIRPGPNPRKDFGDLSELKASIAEHGIIEPLIVRPAGKPGQTATKMEYEITAGGRRWAAKGDLKTVPCIVRTATDEEHATVALVENIQRKDLTPIEEGRAFKHALSKFGGDQVRLAKGLGKPAEYVQRRIGLLSLLAPVQKALEEKKLQLEQAVILSKMDNDAQNKYLALILKEKLGAHQFAARVEDDYIRQARAAKEAGLDDIKFAPAGVHQTVLDETGEKLSGIAMGPGVFLAAVKESIAKQTEELSKKGAKVVQPRKDRYSNSKVELVQTWGSKYKEIESKRIFEEPELFNVAFRIENGHVVKEIYCLNPKKMDKRAPEPHEPGEAKDKPSEREVAKSRAERLDRKMGLFKNTLLVEKTQELSLHAQNVDSKQAKALAVFELLRKADYRTVEAVQKSVKDAKCPELLNTRGSLKEDVLELLLKAPEPSLDRLLARVSTVWLHEMPQKQIEAACEAFGFLIKDHFKMSGEFLELHSTAQLQEMAKELAIDVSAEPALKKEGLIEVILADWKLGKVPKALVNAKPERW